MLLKHFWQISFCYPAFAEFHVLVHLNFNKAKIMPSYKQLILYGLFIKYL
jgi:hypothetical protein